CRGEVFTGCGNVDDLAGIGDEGDAATVIVRSAVAEGTGQIERTAIGRERGDGDVVVSARGAKHAVRSRARWQRVAGSPSEQRARVFVHERIERAGEIIGASSRLGAEVVDVARVDDVGRTQGRVGSIEPGDKSGSIGTKRREIGEIQEEAG